MKVKAVLKLKPLDNESPDSVRIYDLTSEAVQRLNNYVADFVETINILKENERELKASRKKKSAGEISASISYMIGKVNGIYESMKELAEDMPFLVEVLEMEEGDDG